MMFGLTLTTEQREQLRYLTEHGEHTDEIARLLLRLETE